MHAAWHQIVTRAFRRGLGQHRRFDIQKAVVIHKATHKAANFSARFQALGHFRATQIEIAIFQTRFFAVGLIGIERQRIGTIDDSQRGREHFHFAGRHVAVFVLLVARFYRTGQLNAEFIAQFRRELESILMIRVEKDLHDAFAVTHIDKDQAAKITATVNPAAKCNLLTYM